MPRYVALLRGVNVGGSRRLAMGDLRAALTQAGFADVTTHIQSGNVVLRDPARSSAAVAAKVEAALDAAFGLDITVMARSARELATIVTRNPFLAAGADPATLHVGFLAAAPDATAARAAEALERGDGEARVVGTECYLRYPHGVGRSKLTPALLERTLGVPVTLRNWRVTCTLADLAQA